LLLGVHWGQFPEPWELTGQSKPDAAKASKESLVIDGGYVKGLSGMTLVVPVWRIMEVLNLPKFKEQRHRGDEAWKKKKASEPPDPIAESAAGAAENPHHREDFKRLLDAAVKRPKSSDRT
jgi:hypothetical protein